MIELPEAYVLADQMTERLKGRRVRHVVAGASPHRFAWFLGDPEGYNDLLAREFAGETRAHGGLVEMTLGEKVLILHDGATPRFYPYGERVPEKHQLLMEFEDDSTLVVTVRMYGGIYACRQGEDDSPYHQVAREKPSPLTDAFDHAYFESLTQFDGVEKCSAKAFLATEQRIPGLGNGVLQDILWHAQIHPKTKMGALGQEDRTRLYEAVKSLLAEMTVKGGRNVERDLMGTKGGYQIQLGKNTLGSPCPRCGGEIEKAAYMGGNIYFCAGCQK